MSELVVELHDGLGENDIELIATAIALFIGVQAVRLPAGHGGADESVCSARVESLQ